MFERVRPGWRLFARARLRACAGPQIHLFPKKWRHQSADFADLPIVISDIAKALALQPGQRRPVQAEQDRISPQGFEPRVREPQIGPLAENEAGKIILSRQARSPVAARQGDHRQFDGRQYVGGHHGILLPSVRHRDSGLTPSRIFKNVVRGNYGSIRVPAGGRQVALPGRTRYGRASSAMVIAAPHSLLRMGATGLMPNFEISGAARRPCPIGRLSVRMDGPLQCDVQGCHAE